MAHSEFTQIQNVCILIISCILMLKSGTAYKFVAVTDTKIVGGVETTIELLPYLVNLRRNGQFICGGSLVTARCVLTAAHCVQGVTPASLSIYAGADRLSAGGEARQVERHFLSPFYSTATLDMDVAILKLTDTLTGPNVATISLCIKSLEGDETVQISGWGKTNEYADMAADQVRTADVRVVARANCMRAYAGKALLTSTMLCATVPGERDSCSGDSGGPLVYGGRLCGIVSWGFGCAREEYPGVYTNVASRRVNAFVQQILMQHCI